MTSNWLDMSRRAGDANLGQTLLRLAGLAAAAHQYQVALGDPAERHDRESLTLAQRRVGYPDPKAVVAPACTDVAARLADAPTPAQRDVRTEVDA